MASLSDLKALQSKADEAVAVEIKNPGTGEVVFTAQVVSSYSSHFRAKQKAARARLNKRLIEEKDMQDYQEALGAALTAASIVAWDLEDKGKPYPVNDETLQSVLAIPWVATQVAEACGNAQLFFGKPSSD